MVSFLTSRIAELNVNLDGQLIEPIVIWEIIHIWIDYLAIWIVNQCDGINMEAIQWQNYLKKQSAPLYCASGGE